MSCGIKDENNDVCGETFTCGRCRGSERIERMHAELERLEQVLYAARDLIDLELSEEIPVSFTTEWAALKDALENAAGPKRPA